MRKATRKTAKLADPQRLEIYAWEARFAGWDESKLNVSACRSILRRACKSFGVETPSLTTRKGRDCHYVYDRANDLPDVIRLGRKTGLNAAAVLHEAAHQILRKLKIGGRDHGPTFLGLYMRMLEMHDVAPRGALRSWARKHGLRWRSKN